MWRQGRLEGIGSSRLIRPLSAQDLGEGGYPQLGNCIRGEVIHRTERRGSQVPRGQAKGSVHQVHHGDGRAFEG